MKPENFHGVNGVLHSPENWNVDRNGPCEELPIMRRDGICISCWALNWKERLAILFGQHIYAHVASGKTQPPISLTVG